MYKYISITILFLISLEVTAAEHPTSSELLDKLIQTQDKFQSFIMKGKDNKENSINVPLTSAKPTRMDNEKHYRLWESRSDGKRVSSRVHIWGTPSVGGYIPENKPSYMSHMWDGQKYWNNSRSGDSPGIVIINKERNEWENRALFRAQGAGWAKGYFSGSEEPASTVLREARRISVRDKTEPISGVECYVIEADTKCGKYKVWIDPEHGYNIAKARVQLRKGENHLFYGRPFDIAGEKMSFDLENVRFKKIDNVWIPIEADIRYHRVFKANKGHFEDSKTHAKITDIILNPDHEALGSFLPDDISDGAEVHIIQAPHITYTWQDGKVVGKDGKVVMDCLKKRKGDKK